jgi:hypothetical protein
MGDRRRLRVCRFGAVKDVVTGAARLDGAISVRHGEPRTT